jgi:magnesium transporter
MSESGVRTRLWRNGVLEKEDFPFEDISDYICQDDCLVWADIQAPDTDRLEALAEELSLDPLAVEAAVAHHERPKASRFQTHTFITAYALEFDRESGDLEATQISAFVLKNALVTVHDEAWFDIDVVVRRWDENAHLCQYGVRALMYGALDVLVDGYFEVVEALDEEMEALEDILFDETSRTNAVQRRTFKLRKSLVKTRRCILPMREVVNTVMRREVETAEELRPYFEDLYDHVLRASEWTESLRDMLTSVFETNLSLQDARLNNIMKKLTSYAAIIAVPTAVTGFFGQNVPYPGFAKETGFVMSVIIMVSLASALFVVFRRKGWL